MRFLKGSKSGEALPVAIWLFILVGFLIWDLWVGFGAWPGMVVGAIVLLVVVIIRRRRGSVG